MIKFMSLKATGSVHPAKEQEDGTWKSLCGKTTFAWDSMIWVKKEADNGSGIVPIFQNPTVTNWGKGCGFKTCKDFIATTGNVETNDEPLKVMEA